MLVSTFLQSFIWPLAPSVLEAAKSRHDATHGPHQAIQTFMFEHFAEAGYKLQPWTRATAVIAWVQGGGLLVSWAHGAVLGPATWCLFGTYSTEAAASEVRSALGVNALCVSFCRPMAALRYCHDFVWLNTLRPKLLHHSCSTLLTGIVGCSSHRRQGPVLHVLMVNKLVIVQLRPGQNPSLKEGNTKSIQFRLNSRRRTANRLPYSTRPSLPSATPET